jgi:ABC-type nickel/cobalt efflux system permease component RcnA
VRVACPCACVHGGSAADAARCLAMRKAGWRRWRDALCDDARGATSRLAIWARGCERHAWRAWWQWRWEAGHAAHATLTAASWRRKMAWKRFERAVSTRAAERRRWRVARGVCRASLWRRGVVCWRRCLDGERRRRARLLRSTERMEHALCDMRMAVGFHALLREAVAVCRALKVQTNLAQAVAVDAQRLRAATARGWRMLRRAVERSLRALRLERLGLRLVVTRRATSKLHALQKWARSPQMVEFRRWRHQERVLCKVNEMLAASTPSCRAHSDAATMVDAAAKADSTITADRSADGAAAGVGGGVGGGQHRELAASALSQVLDSHRTSLHVMRKLVSSWPSPPTSPPRPTPTHAGSAHACAHACAHAAAHATAPPLANADVATAAAAPLGLHTRLRLSSGALTSMVPQTSVDAPTDGMGGGAAQCGGAHAEAADLQRTPSLLQTPSTPSLLLRGWCGADAPDAPTMQPLAGSLDAAVARHGAVVPAASPFDMPMPMHAAPATPTTPGVAASQWAYSPRAQHASPRPAYFAPPPPLHIAPTGASAPPPREPAPPTAAAKELERTVADDRAAWMRAAAARVVQSGAPPPNWRAVTDGSLFSQIRHDLEETSVHVESMMARRDQWRRERAAVVSDASL